MLFAKYAPLACTEYDKPFQQAASLLFGGTHSRMTSLCGLSLYKQTHRRTTGDDPPPQPFHDNSQCGGNMLGRLGPLPPPYEQHVTRSSTGTELCRRYNLGKCRNPDCKFTHTCWIPGCNGSHTARSVPREPVRAHEAQRLSHQGHDKVFQDTPVLQEHGLTGTSLVRTDVVTPLNAEEFARELCSHLDNAWVTRLLNRIQFGFHIGYSGPRHSCNLPSATQHPEVIDKELGKECAAGRILGPFQCLTFTALVWVQCPKKVVNGV